MQSRWNPRIMNARPAMQLPVSGPDLAVLLPLQHEVPSGLLHTGDQRRSLADVTMNYTNQAETENLFRRWGWEENITRTYEGTGATRSTTLVYVSIHRFDSAQSALNALDYSLADQAVSTGAWEVSSPHLGEATRVLATASDVTIYVQQGDVMIRLTVADAAGSPMPTAEWVMQTMLSRAQ